jgi:hypothetical protein
MEIWGPKWIWHGIIHYIIIQNIYLFIFQIMESWFALITRCEKTLSFWKKIVNKNVFMQFTIMYTYLYNTLVWGMLMHTSVKDWTQNLMKVHQGLDDKTLQDFITKKKSNLTLLCLTWNCFKNSNFIICFFFKIYSNATNENMILKLIQ